MKVEPWHGKGDDHYHDNTKCTEGNNIESENRVPGTGHNLPKCKHCVRLDALETPIWER